MSNSDSDEDLRRAIALSLQEESGEPPVPREVIDIPSSDEDEEDLDAPILAKHVTNFGSSSQGAKKIHVRPLSNDPSHAAGDGQREQHPGAVSVPGQPPVIVAHSPSSPKLSDSAFLGLNRRQMEEERLLRVNRKRKRENAANGGPLFSPTSEQAKTKKTMAMHFAETNTGTKNEMVCRTHNLWTFHGGRISDF